MLVTGATGYVGGRLVPRLLAAGHRVRCLVRDASRLAGPRLARARRGGHRRRAGHRRPRRGARRASTPPTTSCTAWRRRAASTRRTWPRRAPSAPRPPLPASRRIVYLGGLGDPGADLSEHLRSRQATGDALREAGVPVTEFRAAVVVGSGSISFEMIRYLTERLPVMVCPQWVYTRVQPIGGGRPAAVPGRCARHAGRAPAGSSRSAAPTCAPTAT